MKIRVSPKHPTGSYRRGDIDFGKEPIDVPDDEVTEEMINDPNLVVTDDAGNPVEPTTTTPPEGEEVAPPVETQNELPPEEKAPESTSASPDLKKEGEGPNRVR